MILHGVLGLVPDENLYFSGARIDRVLDIIYSIDNMMEIILSQTDYINQRIDDMKREISGIGIINSDTAGFTSDSIGAIDKEIGKIRNMLGIDVLRLNKLKEEMVRISEIGAASYLGTKFKESSNRKLLEELLILEGKTPLDLKIIAQDIIKQKSDVRDMRRKSSEKQAIKFLSKKRF